MEVYMADNKTIIESFFKESDWKYEFDDENKWFTSDFKGENCFLSVSVFFTKDYVAIVSRLPFTVDEKKLPAIAELLHRINDGLVNGCLVLNYDEAEITFQTGITFVDLEFTKDLFENLYMTSIVTADNNAKTIMALLSSDAAPQKVYEDAQALEAITKE
jgi:hypothetical protein